MKKIILALILLSATPTGSGFYRNRWIVWNIGQGQWVTRIESNHCYHFDMGGEKFPWKSLRYFCQNKLNQIFLSHWDWDHVGALSTFRRRFPQSCLALKPSGFHKRMKLLKGLPECPPPPDLQASKGPKNLDSNGQSHIVLFRNFLLPGDSPASQERRWIADFKTLAKTNVLLLGHHGSRTSTSEELLSALPNLRMAVASARWKRYKHPHAEVVFRLKKHQIPLLQTEDWGHIHYLD